MPPQSSKLTEKGDSQFSVQANWLQATLDSIQSQILEACLPFMLQH